jgi:pimeloyl-ACP methyl ester carboxylesterase
VPPIERKKINGIEMSWVERGRGPVVVLLHAFPLDHRVWEGPLEALSSTCRVIAPDLRGFGRSETTGGRVGMRQFAGDVAALLDTLGIAEPVVLGGLSMGGYIALAFWQAFAHRLRALILCDTRAAADSAEVAAARRVAADRVLREGAAPMADSMLPKLFSAQTTGQRPELVASIRAIIMANDPRGIAAAAQGMAERPDMTAALPRVRCPTLVIVGRDDTISPPAEMRAMADALSAASFVQIEDAGHLSPLENPRDVSRAMSEFLARLGP